jgi:hypothetical protein
MFGVVWMRCTGPRPQPGLNVLGIKLNVGRD